jgi:hypothetical protein
MELIDLLLQEHSKAQVLRIVSFIGDDRSRFDELVNLFLKGEYRITQRAAWSLSYCAEAHPEWMQDYWEQFLDYCQTDVHDAVKRNVLRILQNHTLADELCGRVVNWCFEILANPAEPVAIRVFAMSSAYNHCVKYPELALELRYLIESHLIDEKPAFISRGKKVLQKIDKMLNR